MSSRRFIGPRLRVGRCELATQMATWLPSNDRSSATGRGKGSVFAVKAAMVITKSERYREILATLARQASASLTMSSSRTGPVIERLAKSPNLAIVRRLPEGPNQAERIGHHSTVWTEAMDSLGRSSKAILSTPDPYDSTANSALEIATRIASLAVPLGLVTPSQSFGPDFVLSLPGCSRTDIPAHALTRE